MPRPGKKPFITDCRLVFVPTPEPVLLDIAYTFHDEANGKEDYTGNIAACSEIRLHKLQDSRRIEDSNR